MRKRDWSCYPQVYEDTGAINIDQHHPFELAVPVSDSDHSIGASHAPVIVVEYGDFECPNCKQAAPAVRLMLERFVNRVLFVYRHFPLEEVHPRALLAAEAAEAAGAQGKFWPMHDLLFERQPHLGLERLGEYAERLDLDLAEYCAELDNGIHRQRVREHLAGGRESGVRATPAFFIDGRIHDVSFGLHSLIDGVEAALGKCKPGVGN